MSMGPMRILRGRIRMSREGLASGWLAGNIAC